MTTERWPVGTAYVPTGPGMHAGHLVRVIAATERERLSRCEICDDEWPWDLQALDEEPGAALVVKEGP